MTTIPERGRQSWMPGLARDQLREQVARAEMVARVKPQQRPAQRLAPSARSFHKLAFAFWSGLLDAYRRRPTPPLRRDRVHGAVEELGEVRDAVRGRPCRQGGVETGEGGADQRSGPRVR